MKQNKKVKICQLVFYKGYVCIVTSLSAENTLVTIEYYDAQFQHVVCSVAFKDLFIPTIDLLRINNHVNQVRQELGEMIRMSDYSSRINEIAVFSELEKYWQKMVSCSTDDEVAYIQNELSNFSHTIEQKIRNFEQLCDFSVKDGEMLFM